MRLAIALCLLATSSASAAASLETRERELVRGVTLVSSPVDGTATIAVMLELELGLDVEGEGTWGLTALAVAALRDGPTVNLRRGEAVAVGARAGLVTRSAIHRDRITVTLVGPLGALETALWLTAERLEPVPVEPEHLGRLHTALLASADHTLSPPPPPLQHTLTHLFGPRAGHSAWASHRWATLHGSREDSADLHALAAMVADALPRARARIRIAAPAAELAATEAHAARIFGGLAPRDGGPPARRDVDRQTERPARVSGRHDTDSRRLVAVAWDLRGVADLVGIAEARDEALRRVLAALLEAPGGPLHEPLVEGFGVARAVEAVITETPAALIVVVTARGRSPVDARQRLLEALAPLTERGPPDAAFLGAREVARAAFHSRWATPDGRLDTLGAWASAGHQAPDAYRAALAEALTSVRPRELLEWARHALQPERQVVVELTPSDAPELDRVALDADTMSDFLRILVDLRCPRPTRSTDLVTLLDRKYGLTPERYVALTRVVAREPERMRELNHEVEQRCLEYRRLREIFPVDRVVALHRAVRCQADRASDPARRERARASIFRRLDLDPSVYRPLVAMAREDLELAPQLEAIDTECPSPEPPPRRGA